MQIAVWIIIILVIIFLIWLLRRWIRRIIFILILLALAFLIYGIFSPSGAARLWYNVRTFPQRMAGWMGSTKEFLDYDSYKSKISSIGDSIGDGIESLGEDVEKIDLEEKVGDLDVLDGANDEKKGEILEGESSNAEESETIKAFPSSIQFIDIPGISEESRQEEKSEDVGALPGYSKSDLFGIIDDYLEKNLDDDTDILVTVEYEDDGNDPQKIILQTHPR